MRNGVAGGWPTGTVRDRLSERASQRVVGRDRELAILVDALAPDGPPVVFVHGLGGIGKTTLVEAFVDRLRNAGTTAFVIDCAAVEPTERGFLERLATDLGSDPTLTSVVEATTKQGAAVIVLDAYERFRVLDSWIRRTLVPALADAARVVIAGRDAPLPGWDASTEPGAPVRRIELGPLAEDSAIALLRRDGGLDEDAARRLNRSLHGHPLALRVAAAAAVQRPGWHIDREALPPAVASLTGLYLDDLDAFTRRVVDAAATVRRTTVSLLAALLPDADPQVAFTRLQDLPFTSLASDGLHLHDSVQEAAVQALRAADPSRYRAHRRAAWHQLRREVADASHADLWRYTADLLYLIEQPIVREAFFPSSPGAVTVEPAADADADDIAAIIERHDRPGRADALLRWWQHLPQGFSVARNRAGTVVGFDVAFEYRDAQRAWLGEDPLTRRWLEHLRSDRVPADQLVLFNPRWLDRDAGERPCDSQAAFFTETKRVYMELRPHLRRLYLALTDVTPYAVVAPKLGFVSLPDPQVVVDGVTYHSFVLDFGPGSVDAWLSWLIGSELGDTDGPFALDPRTLEVRIDGHEIHLSRLEFGVLSVLVGRDGRAVSRAELIGHVWGTAYLGGSNVVDAVVRTLRRKLGDHADLVETVRGVGYRARVKEGGVVGG